MHVHLIASVVVAASLFPFSLRAESMQIVTIVRRTDFPCRGDLVLTCRDGDGCDSGRRIALSNENDWPLPVPATGAWDFSVESTNCWAAPRTVLPATGARRLEIELWPKATLSGSLDRTIDRGTVRRLHVRLTSPKGSDRAFDAEIVCPVVRGEWSCGVPAALLDVRLQADGFAPVYLWNVNAEQGRIANVGALRFARGASIAGWIEVPSGAVAGASVELSPQNMPDAPPRPEDANRSTVTRTNGRGFFQLAGVDPGVYTVTARAKGWSPAYATDVKVTADREEILRDPLVLSPLASMSVIINPPVAPDGAPWKITLSRASPIARAFQVIRQETVHESGFWTGTELEAETYRLTLANGSGSVFETRDVEVTAPTSSLSITVRAVPIAGLLLAGDEPLQAKVSFVDSRYRVSVDSDHDGSFAGSLPHAGEWGVEVKPASGATVRTRSITVEESDGTEPARVRIVLPGGRLSGSVVDEDGAPLQALVRVRTGATLHGYAATDPQGKFTIVGLPPTKSTVEAEARNYGIALLEHEVAKDPQGDLRIVVSRQRTVAVRLVTKGGRPVSGAIVWQLLPPVWRRVEKTSNPDGVVDLQVPATGNIDAVVFAAGFPVRLISIPPNSKGNVVFALQPVGGRIRFVADEDRWPFIAPEGGSFFPVASLFFRPNPAALPQGFSSSGFSPEFEPGTYTVCPTARYSDRCQKSAVAPGDTVVVDVRPKKEQS